MLIYLFIYLFIWPAKNTLNFSFKHLYLKNELGDPHFFIIEL